MITAWIPAERGLQKSECTADALPANAVWVDLFEVSREEELLVESRLGVEIPTRAEMQEIEASSRLYREGQVVYMTATMLVKTETDMPESSQVTFILTHDRMITLRYGEPWSFKTFAQRAPKSGVTSAEQAFVTVLETTIERLADMLEIVQIECEHLSQQIFRRRTGGGELDLHRCLAKIGTCGHILGKVRESLLDKNRVMLFADQAASEWLTAETRARITAAQRDISSISDHATFTSGKINFLLDATLGLISIEQNRIIKIFSIAAVIFLPPTLVASIYGMNLQLWPHADQWWGFPVVMVIILLSIGLTLWYFKRQRWM